jgi:hypothetical protein
MQTPKEQFAKHPYHGAFYELTASADFVAAVNYAVLEYVTRYQVTAEQLQGANNVIRILMTLADPPTEPGPEPKPDPMQPTPYKPAYRSNK